MRQASIDEQFMRRALNLARKGAGRTSPNPMVGCVIVKGGKVIAEGWHQHCGGDHAEVATLRKAGAKARGATMYVTLEPCSHWGRTPPCVDAIVKAGIRKVVVAMVDPNPVNNGKSLERLGKAGVDVVAGVCIREAGELNAAFVKYIAKGMPYVVAKSAQTIDGKIATRSGDSKWITSKEARTFSKQKRNEFDAILAGIKTILADDPCLCAPNKRIIKVVLDSRLKTPLDARLLTTSEPGQVIVATTKKATSTSKKRLEGAGARVMVCPKRDGGVDLKWLFKELAKEGVASILIEGGASVIGSAFKAGLVDRWHVYLAPILIGDERARSAVVGLKTPKLKQALRFSLVVRKVIGGDFFIEAEVKNRS